MDPIQSWLDAKEVRRMAESLMEPPPEVDQTALDAGYGDEFEGFAASKSNDQAPVAPAPVEEQRPIVTPAPSTQSSASTSAKMTVAHALADAKRVAEGSGMLTPQAPQPPEVNIPNVALNPETRSEAPATPVADSPFQLCEDQSEDEEVPLARQVSPPQAPQPQVQSSGGARGPFLARLKKFSILLRERTDARAMFLIDSEGQILIDEVGNAKLVQVARTLANASHAAERQTAGAADVGNLHVKIGASATLEVIPCHSGYGLLILGVVCPAPMGTEVVQQVADYLEKTVEPNTEN